MEATITAASDTSVLAASTSEWTRWGQLLLGITCLVMIANLQYGWTLFIDPIDAKYQWGRAPIYTAKGTAALLVPLGNVLTTVTGGWTAVFILASALNILAAFLAFAVLKPMRLRTIPKETPA